MKWPWKKKEQVKCEHHHCQKCDGIRTRQTTLDEFYPDIFLPKGQKKLTDFDPGVIPTNITERVGMKSDKRPYRGNI